MSSPGEQEAPAAAGNQARPSPGRRHRDRFYARLNKHARSGEQPNDARIGAAIGLAGGPEAVRGAFSMRREGQEGPLKWSAACCESAFGTPAGDPCFGAWVRLAAIPVREIKRVLAQLERERANVPEQKTRRPAPSSGNNSRPVRPRRESHGRREAPTAHEDGQLSRRIVFEFETRENERAARAARRAAKRSNKR